MAAFRTAGAAGLVSVALCGAAFASPPLIQPGAPGEASRTLTAEESVAMSRTGYTPADVTFMQHMIVHHQQAVDMVALIEARTDTAGVASIGRRISLTQEGEMAQMRGWLRARGEPLEDEDLKPGHAHDGHGGHGGHGDHDAHGDQNAHRDHAGHGDHHAVAEPADPYTTPLMHGMLSPAEMDALAASQGEAFDRLFLEGMIHHHQGAIDMVNALLADDLPGVDVRLSLRPAAGGQPGEVVVHPQQSPPNADRHHLPLDVAGRGCDLADRLSRLSPRARPAPGPAQRLHRLADGLRQRTGRGFDAGGVFRADHLDRRAPGAVRHEPPRLGARQPRVDDAPRLHRLLLHAVEHGDHPRHRYVLGESLERLAQHGARRQSLLRQLYALRQQLRALDRLFERDVEAVDLRLPDRITVRASPVAAERVRLPEENT